MEEKKVWTRKDIEELLNRNDKAVERALVFLYQRQTRDEQDTEQTRHHNDQGFCAYDAKRMTYYAKLIQRGFSLRPNQLAWCREFSPSGQHRLGKYYRQLLEGIQEKETSRKAA